MGVKSIIIKTHLCDEAPEIIIKTAWNKKTLIKFGSTIRSNTCTYVNKVEEALSPSGHAKKY